MKNYFVFNGISSADFNVYLFDEMSDTSPERVYEEVEIAGKNGSILLDKKQLLNRQKSYIAVIYEDAEKYYDAFKNYLLSQTGYQRLEDTLHPDEYCMAYFNQPIEPIVSRDRGLFKFSVIFTCKPQRYLHTGEIQTTLTASGTIYNPTLNDAKPLLRVYGTGTVSIGSTSITLSTNSSYTDIDCEIMEAYYGSTSRNKNITTSSLEFPVLKKGNNNITLGSGITKVIITPRWWIS